MCPIVMIWWLKLGWLKVGKIPIWVFLWILYVNWIFKGSYDLLDDDLLHFLFINFVVWWYVIGAVFLLVYWIILVCYWIVSSMLISFLKMFLEYKFSLHSHFLILWAREATLSALCALFRWCIFVSSSHAFVQFLRFFHIFCYFLKKENSLSLYGVVLLSWLRMTPSTTLPLISWQFSEFGIHIPWHGRFLFQDRKFTKLTISMFFFIFNLLNVFLGWNITYAVNKSLKKWIKNWKFWFGNYVIVY